MLLIFDSPPKLRFKFLKVELFSVIFIKPVLSLINLALRFLPVISPLISDFLKLNNPETLEIKLSKISALSISKASLLILIEPLPARLSHFKKISGLNFYVNSHEYNYVEMTHHIILVSIVDIFAKKIY